MRRHVESAAARQRAARSEIRASPPALLQGLKGDGFQSNPATSAGDSPLVPDTAVRLACPRLSLGWRRRRPGQADGKYRSGFDQRRHVNSAPVAKNYLAHDEESQTQARLRALRRFLRTAVGCLNEGLEDHGERLGRDGLAGIEILKTTASGWPSANKETASSESPCCRVVQKVRQHLVQPRNVCVDGQLTGQH